MKFIFIIGIIALALMGVFVIQNIEVVSVDFLFWSVEASRAIIYLVILLIGVFIGWLGKSLRML
jgi:uncharacterized integral membrane protein